MSPVPPPVRSLVLVVDDTPETLGFLTEALERAGYTALVATGGRQALALVERIAPDLILLDAMMPDMDGFETCARLKAGPLASVPVIFMTALSETEDIVRGLAAGGVDYVTKPIILDELFARMGVHLANAKATRSARAALDSSGSVLIAFDTAGTVVWTTPLALALLDGLLPTGRRVTPTLADDLRALADARAVGPLVVPGRDGLSVSLAFVSAAAGEWLFRVSRHDPRSDEKLLADRLQLTAREAEVLLWVARGKANRDIGAILDLSPRTVNKHLETVFAKLGVENRASAAVLATRALDDR